MRVVGIDTQSDKEKLLAPHLWRIYRLVIDDVDEHMFFFLFSVEQVDLVDR